MSEEFTLIARLVAYFFTATGLFIAFKIIRFFVRRNDTKKELLRSAKSTRTQQQLIGRRVKK